MVYQVFFLSKENIVPLLQYEIITFAPHLLLMAY